MPPENEQQQGSQQQGEGGGTPTPPATQNQVTPPVGYVPQDEVSRIAAREKDQGERAGRRKFLESLGFDPEKTKPEDVKALLDKQREEETARLTEQERKDKELAAREKALADRESQAKQAEHRARLTEVLVTAGVASANLDDARTLLEKVPADADEKALKAEVEALKQRLPALFAPTAPPPPPGGGFQGTPPRPQANGDAYAKGRERAIAMGLAPAPATS